MCENSRIVFSTFFQCKSSYTASTARAKSGKAQIEHMFSGLPPGADIGSRTFAVALAAATRAPAA
jgi:hypothetical protein